jgi:hypothetical protein
MTSLFLGLPLLSGWQDFYHVGRNGRSVPLAPWTVIKNMNAALRLALSAPCPVVRVRSDCWAHPSTLFAADG